MRTASCICNGALAVEHDARGIGRKFEAAHIQRQRPALAHLGQIAEVERRHLSATAGQSIAHEPDCQVDEVFDAEVGPHVLCRPLEPSVFIGTLPDPEKLRGLTRNVGAEYDIIGYQGGSMADILLRDVPDEVLAALDAHAARLGVSRSEYLRRRLAQDASLMPGTVSVADLALFGTIFEDLAGPDVMSAAWQ